jgi:hypothetical protein
MSSILESIDELCYHHSSMMEALDQITHDIWMKDRPIDNIVQWMNERSWHTFPKRRHRWLHLLTTQFSCMILTVTEHHLQRVRDEIDANVVCESLRPLYTHILDNARVIGSGNTYTVMIRYNPEELLCELLERNILHGLYSRIRINTCSRMFRR